MNVRKRLFLTFSLYIALALLSFVIVTQLILNTMLNGFIEDAHSAKGSQIKSAIVESYSAHDGDWGEMEEAQIISEVYSVAVISDTGETVYSQGAESVETLQYLGIRDKVALPLSDDEEEAAIYFIDDSIKILSILQYVYRDSITLVLLAGSVVVALILIVAAYFVSKKLTAPLESLIPVLSELGKGNFSKKVPSYSTVEYNQISHTVNDLSEQLERAELNRKQMTADIAHELRTPLTILTGKLESFQYMRTEIPVYELLPLQDDLSRLQSIIDDLQLLSLARSDKLPLSLKRTDVRTLVEKVGKHLEFEAEKKGQYFAVKLPKQVVYAEMDEQRMTQVLLNLTANAIRYTPERGEISVELQAEGTHVHIIVADNGNGIRPEVLPFIFERFYRAEEARDRDSGGSGLGLAIAKELVEIQHGTIDVESTISEGTTFTVAFPKHEMELL